MFLNLQTIKAQKRGNSLIDSLLPLLNNAQEDSNKINLLVNLSNAYATIYNIDQGISNAQKAEILANKIGFNKGLANAYNAMAKNKIALLDYISANQYQQQSLKIFIEDSNQEGIVTTLGFMGDLQFKQKEYKKALELYLSALKIAENSQLEQTVIYGSNGLLSQIATSYEAIGDFSAALQYLNKGLIVNTQLKNTINIASFKVLQSNIFIHQKNYKKAIELLLESFELTAKNGNWKEAAKFQIELNQFAFIVAITIFIFSLLMFALVIFVITILFRAKLKSSYLKQELEKEKMVSLIKENEYKAKMNEMTFAALRSQMNPHFIFNCLNSIKLYTEQNNTEAASLYLTKFAKLIRIILDSTRNETVAISSEIESIKLYLEMEKMRIKEKLQFKIEVDRNIDVDYIEIPSLLIQPYIENAIWHGIMNKEGGGAVLVKIMQTADKKHLQITIKDDGIGRTKSEELKTNKQIHHSSFGTKLTSDRIAIFNQKYYANAEVVITDLYDEYNLPSGTLVTILLPLL